jgi:quercetin dioxygenase-like cupin family protein
VRAGDVIWNPLSGEKAMVVASAEETGGAYIESVFRVEPGGFLPGGAHYHDHQSETFTVQRGRMGLSVEGRSAVLEEGETAVVEPGTLHAWSNATEGDEIEVRVRIEPALDFELLIAAIWGLCADGLTDARGNPDPLRGALIAQRFEREYRAARPPRAVQRLLFPALAAIARRRGLESIFDRYGSPETHPSVALALGRFPDQVMGRAGAEVA